MDSQNMNKAFPIRSQSHQLEELSDMFFREKLTKKLVADKKLAAMPLHEMATNN